MRAKPNPPITASTLAGCVALARVERYPRRSVPEQADAINTVRAIFGGHSSNEWKIVSATPQ